MVDSSPVQTDTAAMKTMAMLVARRILEIMVVAPLVEDLDGSPCERRARWRLESPAGSKGL
jgi:hypothetical protein